MHVKGEKHEWEPFGTIQKWKSAQRERQKKKKKMLGAKSEQTVFTFQTSLHLRRKAYRRNPALRAKEVI